jgi:hypothetical protein
VGRQEAADAAAPPCVDRAEGVGEDEPDGRIRLCGPRWDACHALKEEAAFARTRAAPILLPASGCFKAFSLVFVCALWFGLYGTFVMVLPLTRQLSIIFAGYFYNYSLNSYVVLSQSTTMDF